MQKIGSLISGALKAPTQTQYNPTGKIKHAKLDDLPITHPKLKTAVDMARRWHLENKKLIAQGKSPMSLVMVGPNGVGKTHIARAILWSHHYADDDGNPIAPIGKFFMASDLIGLLDSGNNIRDLATPPKWQFDEKNGRIISGCPMLIIDDVGSEQHVKYVASAGQTGEIQSRYFRIVNYCLDYHISLIITASNECDTMSKLAAHVGPRCWSRLQQMAPKGYMMSMKGVPDWRIKASGR